ncbi:hypothetical protein NC653_038169 [Populus alba x Populus x berolinensis]|uniref:Uncharacterized protein n=1 Tax=Populus alba x Populus x berolinensis TaxID=444605 RepID=A0AAD6LFZ6_9ROSI|nr:hypothetical protein NC653_038169 [Populus alba x Populus x berolinensis]
MTVKRIETTAYFVENRKKKRKKLETEGESSCLHKTILTGHHPS